MKVDSLNRRTVVAFLAGGSAVGAGISAGKLRMEGAATVQSGTIIDLADFGVSPNATPQQNLAGFKLAVASTPAGATLHLSSPKTAPCRIDTSRGWRDAVQIDRPMTLRIDGQLQATDGGIRNNPPYMLNVTVPGVTILGSGQIAGSGAIDDTNAGIDETLSGLVRVAADDFTLTELEIVAPPKVGLMLYQCHGARIVRARFTGGPKVYGDTGHFGIRVAGGGKHVFHGNRFYPAPDNGMLVQCIMLSGSHDNLFTENHALHPYEKLIYGYGDRNIARNNTVIGNPGFIPGTNVQGTITSVYRFHGSSNRVENNFSQNCAGGAQMMDGTAHTVIGNRFLSCGQSAISAYQSDLSNSIFSDNRGTRGALAGALAGDGMRLVSDRSAARNLVVQRNQISGFSVADPIAALLPWEPRKAIGRNSVVRPKLGNGRFYMALGTGRSGAREPRWPDTPGAVVTDGTLRWVAVAYEGGQAEIKLIGRSADAPIADSAILDNRTSGGRLGIVAQFVARSRLTGNVLSATEWGLVEEMGRANAWRANQVQGGGERRVRGLAPSSASLSDR